MLASKTASCRLLADDWCIDLGDFTAINIQSINSYSWVAIQSGMLTPPLDRGEEYGEAIVVDAMEYNFYRFDFNSNSGDNLM